MFRLLHLVSRLPFWFWYGLSDLLTWLAADVLKYRQAVITENLKNAFPERSEAEISALRRAFYRNLSDVVVESVKALSISEEALRRRVVYPNPEEVNAKMQTYNTLLIMTSHQSNWEWLLLSGKLQAKVPLHGVYQELNNAFSERTMRYIRGRFGAPPVKRKELGRLIVRQRRQKHIYALVADQTPRKSEDKHWQTFLNQPTAFLTGTERLAKMMQAPVVFAEMRREKRGHYRVILKTLAEPPYEKEKDIQLIRRFAEHTEEAIRRSPADWLWSHRRWKLKPAGTIKA